MQLGPNQEKQLRPRGGVSLGPLTDALFDATFGTMCTSSMPVERAINALKHRAFGPNVGNQGDARTMSKVTGVVDIAKGTVDAEEWAAAAKVADVYTAPRINQDLVNQAMETLMDDANANAAAREAGVQNQLLRASEAVALEERKKEREEKRKRTAEDKEQKKKEKEEKRKRKAEDKEQKEKEKDVEKNRRQQEKEEREEIREANKRAKLTAGTEEEEEEAVDAPLQPTSRGRDRQKPRRFLKGA